MDAPLHTPPRRVWSLIVTLTGDRHVRGRGPVSTAEIIAALAPAGIAAPAVRTALHRLRADGWIATERIGRGSRHRLTPAAAAETRAAAARVYGAGPADAQRWWLSFAEARPDGFATLAPSLHVGRTAVPGPGAWASALCPSEAQRAAAWPPALRAELDGLLARAAAAAEGPTARLLVLHDWRRVALRAPDLPDAMGPAGWRGAEARTALRPWIGPPTAAGAISR